MTSDVISLINLVARLSEQEMQTLPLKIADSTLRDGEQQAGLFFSSKTKYKLAHLIAQSNANYINITPWVCDQDLELAKVLVSEGFANRLSADTLIGKQFIDLAQKCGIKHIVLFKGLSDRLLWLRDPKIRQRSEFQGKTIDDDIPTKIIEQIRQDAIDLIVENLRYATAQGLKVDFAIEDASRADFHFLVQCLRSFNPYIKHCILCDTVGVLNPEKSYVWINDLLQSTTGIALGVHYHNDLGMALENTLQSIMAGATLVSGTFGGIGERAGNVALEEVLNGLRIRFGIEVAGINYDAIAHIIDYMNQMGIRRAPPYSQLAQSHESGIHVNSLLSDAKSYAVFPHNAIEILFGKGSGASNFRYLFEKQLQNPQPQAKYEHMRAVIKSLAIKQERYFTAEEVVELWNNGIFN